MSTSESRRSGFLSVPLQSLPKMISLAERILEGMKQHAADPDYPAKLATYNLDAGRNEASTALLAQKAAKAQAKRATEEAVGERTRFGVILEKIQADLIAQYGKRNPILYDYGFRTPTPRKPAKHSAKKAATGTAAKTTGSSATSESPSASEPSTTPPSIPPAKA